MSKIRSEMNDFIQSIGMFDNKKKPRQISFRKTLVRTFVHSSAHVHDKNK